MAEEQRAGGPSGRISPGRAFSAVIPSMWPTDLVSGSRQAMGDSAVPHLDELYDEFGFARDKETNPGQEHHGLVEQEDPWQRQQWAAYLEYTQRQQAVTARTCGNMCWQCSRAFRQVNNSNQQGAHPSATTPRWDMVERMARRGVPHSLRPQVWMRLTGACQKKEMEHKSYHHLVTVSVPSSSQHGKVFSQIEEDLLRTMSRNACFSQLTSPGLPRLRRVLRALACRYPRTGYCQGTGPVVASLLLFLEEEDAFWMMCALIDDLLPESYYSPALTGIQVDQRVLRQLLATCLPATDRLLQTHDVELSLVTMPWFLTLFAGVLPMRVLLRLWDVLFCSGSQALFLVALALMELKEGEVKTLDSSAQILSVLSALPANVTSAEELIELAVRVSSTVTSAVVSHERRKHLTYLLAFQSAAWDSEDDDNPSKQPSAFPTRWAVRWLGPWWKWVTGQPEEENEEEGEEGKQGRNRNPRHTELMLEAREAILVLAGVCQSADAEAFERPAQENYSVDSHAHDLVNYAKRYCQRHHLRHRHHCRHVRSATCRLDQDAHRHFGNNDTGTPIQTPAEPWCQGDPKGPSSRLHSHSNLAELRIEAISELVGSRLQPALTAVMMHGLRKSKVIGGDRHPWLVLQEVAEEGVEKASQNECCRQMLCRSYRLDEDDCSVPTPQDLLHLAVQTINTSRGPGHESMDLKLHSLLCYGLNEQVLHLWLECLCCCSRVVAKWYQPWALLCTPAWVHLKCQLRLLSSTAFQLTGDGEVSPRCSEAAHPLPQGLKDMRPAQQLFSWDL